MGIGIKNIIDNQFVTHININSCKHFAMNDSIVFLGTIIA